jgi:hypothetical protein
MESINQFIFAVLLFNGLIIPALYLVSVLFIYGRKKTIKTIFPPLDRLVWKKSPFVWIILLILRILRFFNLYTYIEIYYSIEEQQYNRYSKSVPVYWAEIWVFFLLLIQILCIYQYLVFPIWFQIFVSIYGLYNIILSAANDAIEFPVINEYQEGKYFIEIRHPVRWFLLGFVNVAQIILCFGLMFLVCGKQFKPEITDPITAIYKSLSTFTTMSYGKPISNYGKLIEIAELFLFLTFFALKLPIFLSAFRDRVVIKSADK